MTARAVAESPVTPEWWAAQRAAFERVLLTQMAADFELHQQAETGAHYRTIHESAVDDARRRVVSLTLALVLDDLAIEAPTVAWFAPAPAREWLAAQRNGTAGYFRKDEPIRGQARIGSWTIDLRRECEPADIAQTVAHECRHLWQSAALEFAGATREAKEADATSYADRWATTGKALAMAAAVAPVTSARE
jgi:hypothetical protein